MGASGIRAPGNGGTKKKISRGLLQGGHRLGSRWAFFRWFRLVAGLKAGRCLSAHAQPFLRGLENSRTAFAPPKYRGGGPPRGGRAIVGGTFWARKGGKLAGGTGRLRDFARRPTHEKKPWGHGGGAGKLSRPRRFLRLAGMGQLVISNWWAFPNGPKKNKRTARGDGPGDPRGAGAGKNIAQFLGLGWDR